MIRLLLSIAIVVPFFLITTIFIVWLLRKVVGFIQLRIGPLHYGPHGSLQLAFDGIKLISKEDIINDKADKILFVVAPFIMFIPAILSLIAIPIYNNIYVRNFDIGIFYVFAAATVIPVGVIIAGWSSYNKYSLLGALRAAAQQISYEVPLLLATMGAVMFAGSMSLVEIVKAQSSVWYILLQPFGFIFFFITMLAELNQTPFDMPEAESELVAGYFAEYTGIRFGFILFSEMLMLFVMSAVITILFLGGWNAPLPFLNFVPGVIWFFIKTYTIVLTVMWIRGTLPRVRIDQMMDFSWKVLLPLTLANIMITAGVLAVIRM